MATNWMNSVMNLGKAALERMSAPVDPNQVKVVNTTELAPIPTMDRCCKFTKSYQIFKLYSYAFNSQSYTPDMLSLYLNLFREGCLLLYGPKPPTNQGGARSLKGDGKALPTFEIAVHSSKYSTQSLSIFRTSDKGINYIQFLDS